MIWENEVKLICMLCNCFEGKSDKCSEYWVKKETGPKKAGQFELEHVSTAEVVKNLVKTKIKITNTSTQESRFVTHYHDQGWNDDTAPTQEHLNAVKALVNKGNKARTKKASPVVVHCSAGIGRTGTLIAILAIIE